MVHPTQQHLSIFQLFADKQKWQGSNFTQYKVNRERWVVFPSGAGGAWLYSLSKEGHNNTFCFRIHLHTHTTSSLFAGSKTFSLQKYLFTSNSLAPSSHFLPFFFYTNHSTKQLYVNWLMSRYLFGIVYNEPFISKIMSIVKDHCTYLKENSSIFNPGLYFNTFWCVND